MQKETSDQTSLLFDAVLTLETKEECRAFFQDLCTVAELRAMAQRLEVAQLLDDGLIYNRRVQRHHQPGEPGAAIRRGRL